MELDPVLPVVVGITLIVFLISMALRMINQPHVVGYILAGVLIGPFGVNLIRNEQIVSSLGNLGIVLLLFFIGMRVSISHLFKHWRVAIFGTGAQIVMSLLLTIALGYWLDWPLSLKIMLGFVISISSTAEVLKMLEEWGELTTRVGRNVLGILLVEDIAIIPMLVALDFFGKQGVASGEIFLSLIGAVLLIHLVIWVMRSDRIELPFTKYFHHDRETQVLMALIICFGLAVVATMFGLSAALGAFIAGVIVAQAKQTQWVHQSLEPFRVVFVALFFIYVGVLIDLDFVLQNVVLIGSLVVLLMIFKTALNAGILRVLGDKWQGAVYGGALLSEVGEFSFLLGLVGWESGLIPYYGYQFILSIISISLLIGPLWIMLFKHVLGHYHLKRVS